MTVFFQALDDDVHFAMMKRVCDNEIESKFTRNYYTKSFHVSNFLRVIEIKVNI